MNSRRVAGGLQHTQSLSAHAGCMPLRIWCRLIKKDPAKGGIFLHTLCLPVLSASGRATVNATKVVSEGTARPWVPAAG